jgi:oligopeptide/dipeptide ABC transporter ATP-binding protein
MNGNGPLLTVRDLRTYFQTADGLVKAVDGVSFAIPRGKTFALVGESGCGKSVTAFSIMRLLAIPPARIASGQIEFDGADLLSTPEREMRRIRGGRISMIFQEPMTSLNPVYTCGNQIVEAIRLHRKVSARQGKQIAIDMLAKVGIPDPDQRFREYPHQLSGGMRQRVMIAMALSCQAKLLIADEPTTALDVTIQAQILDLLRGLQNDTGLSIMLITHDLAVVSETAHIVAVMYASKLVELASADELFGAASHPYTRGLFRSLPRLGQRSARLQTIPGNVPNPLEFPPGCKFHTRCSLTRERARNSREDQTLTITCDGEQTCILKQCATLEPPLREIAAKHFCACWEAEGYPSASKTDPTQVAAK